VNNPEVSDLVYFSYPLILRLSFKAIFAGMVIYPINIH